MRPRLRAFFLRGKAARLAVNSRLRDSRSDIFQTEKNISVNDTGRGIYIIFTFFNRCGKPPIKTDGIGVYALRNKGMQTFSREDGKENADCRENDNIVVRTRKSKRSVPEKTGIESRFVRKEK